MKLAAIKRQITSVKIMSVGRRQKGERENESGERVREKRGVFE